MCYLCILIFIFKLFNMYYINDKLKGVIMIYKWYIYMIKWCLYIVYFLIRYGFKVCVNGSLI